MRPACRLWHRCRCGEMSGVLTSCGTSRIQDSNHSHSLSRRHMSQARPSAIPFCRWTFHCLILQEASSLLPLANYRWHRLARLSHLPRRHQMSCMDRCFRLFPLRAIRMLTLRGLFGHRQLPQRCTPQILSIQQPTTFKSKRLLVVLGACSNRYRGHVGLRGKLMIHQSFLLAGLIAVPRCIVRQALPGPRYPQICPTQGQPNVKRTDWTECARYAASALLPSTCGALPPILTPSIPCHTHATNVVNRSILPRSTPP